MKIRIFLFTAVLSLFAIEAGASIKDAQWVGAPWDSETYDDSSVLPAPEFRKLIEVSKSLKSATVDVTGLGFFEFYVNGVKVGLDVLSPNESSYGHRQGLPGKGIPLNDENWRGFRVYYLSYDVTSMLKTGENELGAIVGNGFYSTGQTGWVLPYGTPRFICELTLNYSDGTSETVRTDSSWEARRSHIVKNNMFSDEVYDANLVDEWQPCALRNAPDGELMPQTCAPDRVMEVLEPETIEKMEDGSYEVDFGDYISGWVKMLDFTAPADSSVSVEYLSECNGNGSSVYISDGKHVSEFAPRFKWFCFNKVRIKGWQGELKPENLRAEAVYISLAKTGNFKCSNELFNRIDHIYWRSQTDNMHLGVATDCPHREKGPYTGDGEVSCVAVMHNFDADAFYRKWLRDMSDCQDTVTGYVPNGAPWHPGCGGGVGWGAAMNIIPWEHYLHYGDISVLEENYVQMTEQLRFMTSWRREDGTMFMQMPDPQKPLYWMNLGEWCPAYGLPKDDLVHTYFLWKCAHYTALAAEALGKTEDAQRYAALADDVAKSFDAAYWNPETGDYGPDGQNIFALAVGVPEAKKASVLAAVRKEMESNGGHLMTGIFGTQLIFEVLAENGMNDLAFRAMNNTTEPGYGAWVAQGAQTTWEYWDGTHSRNHPMFGGGLTWLYRKLAGLEAAEPGYKKILLRPMPVGDVTWASYSTVTPYGEASISWKILRSGRLRVKALVPKGTTATFELPDGTHKDVKAGKRVCRSKTKLYR